jgi:uncharacterized protein YjlB
MKKEAFNIFKVKNFKIHKEILINLIDKIPTTFRHLQEEHISHTDWAIMWNRIPMKKEYLEYFNDNIYRDYASQLCKSFNCKEVEIRNIWFQKYNTGDFHNKHRHGDAHFTNVFYLKLPEENSKTKIYDLNNQLITIDVEEGDILTFPAFLLHESVANESKDSKIIISFNINIHN